MSVTLENPKVPRITYGGEEDDRLSNLPAPILHHILSYLDTIDVIKTSAVSRKWRYLWLSMPYLYFDIFHKVWSEKMKTLSLLAVNDQFKDFVNWVLMSQNRSVNIKRIWLNCLNSDDDYTFYRWINAVARRNVEELILVIFSGTEIPVELPHSLITCESLMSLKICFGRNTVVKLPTSSCFSRLKSLFLLNVELSNYISFRNLISSCRLLENLTMHACNFRHFKILDISSTCLKKLVIDNGISSASGDGLSNCELRIACPSLVSFNFVGPLARNFTLQDLKSLWNVFFCIERLPEHIEDCHHLMCKIFKGLCNIKALKLLIGCKELCLDNVHPALAHVECFSFYSLKSLKLAMCVGDGSMKLMVNLLNCSPNLEALTIYFDKCEFSKWVILDQAISCLTYHLKVVELFEVKGKQNELELVKFLLENGHGLQKMSISWAKDIMNTEEIILEIMKFPRTSSDIALRFLEPKSQVEFSEL